MTLTTSTKTARATRTPCEIVVVRQLDAGIYRLSGGGQAREWSRHTASARGLTLASNSSVRERLDAHHCYGSVGAGIGYLVVVPRGASVDCDEAVRLPRSYRLETLPVRTGMVLTLADWSALVDAERQQHEAQMRAERAAADAELAYLD